MYSQPLSKIIADTFSHEEIELIEFVTVRNTITASMVLKRQFLSYFLESLP